MSWTDASGGGTIYRAYLAQSLNGGAWTKSTVTGTTQKAYTAMAVGNYAYKVQIYSYEPELKKEFFEYETPAVTVQVWKSIPAAPGAIAGPTSVMPSASFALTWPAPPGVVTRYEVYEGAQKLAPDPTSPSIAIPGRASGQYQYKARACNGLGCGPYGAIFTVNVDANLTTMVADGPFTQDAPLAQGWVGRLPGEAATDGGAASYRIDVEVPPGRGGMQPQVSLGYSSRSGNGIAGVGWSLSAGGSIYRCPRTFRQDEAEGGGAPVRLTSQDRLCLDGARLVAVSGAYGGHGASYRTEVDQFSRITQTYVATSPASSFKVEQKSGRIAWYEARPNTGASIPDTWFLVREADQQGNCVAYDYSPVAARNGGADSEWVLGQISYTGTLNSTQTQCLSTGRTVVLEYTLDRGDKRTTYRAGAASMLTARLSAIVTRVAGVASRRYELAYAPSGATARSLLRSVRVCAGAACRTDGQDQLPATTFTYQEAGPDFGPARRFEAPVTSPVWSEWRVGLVADQDGDGASDMLYHRITAAAGHQRYLRLSTRTDLMELTDSVFTPGEFSAAGGGGHVDVNVDGRADVPGTPGGMLAFLSYGSGGWYQSVTNVPWSQRILIPQDFDGDGLVDMVGDTAVTRQLAPGTAATAQAPHGTPPTFELSPTIPVPQTVAANEVRSKLQDLNGDGYADSLFDGLDATAAREPRVVFYRGPGNAQVELLVSALGGPAGSFKQHGHRRWLDVNADGLPDIYEPGPFGPPGTLWVNRGGVPGAGMFRPVQVTIDAQIPWSRWQHAQTIDFDADGQAELLVPWERTLDYCGTDMSHPAGPEIWCGDEFDLPGANYALDQSIFRWRAYRFVEQADGTFALTFSETNLEAPAGTAMGPGFLDYSGAKVAPAPGEPAHAADGLADVSYHLARSTFEQPWGTMVLGFYPGMPEADYGPYVRLNRAKAPDLLTGVTDGLGAASAWTYQPLAMRAVDGPTCPASTGDFYVAHHEAEKPLGDVFFTSSMWVVAAMQTSHGGYGTPTNPAGLNRTCYRYEDGMLDVLGRGFLGFKKIVAEEALETAVGEAGTPGGVSPNNLRTTTVFNQEFPFTNTPRSVTVEAVADGRKLAETTSWWHAVQEASGKPWVRYQTASTEKKWDPATGAPLATTTSVTELDLVSGEATRTCTISSDDGMASVYSGLPASVTPSLTIFGQETRVLTNDQSGWWLGRLDSSTTLVGAYTGSADFIGARAPTTVDDFLWNGTPVACPSPPAASRQVTTAFTWYPASFLAAQSRKLQRQEVTPAGATESEVDTSFTHGAHGNPLTKTVKARAVLDGLGNRVAHTTTFGASADGYFVETETNPLGHAATSRRDAATGQVAFQQEVLGGPTATTTLDALGRPLTTSRSGAQPVNQRTVACSALVLTSAVACEPLEVMARQTTQAGAPTRTEYLDRLGRVLRTATVSLDGSILLTEVAYNERGLKVVEYAPRVAGGAEFPTSYSGFDRLGRPTRKEVQRSGSIFEGGPDTRPLVTKYTHTGHNTEIVADEGGPVPLSMSRTYDAKGRLARTVQRIDGRDLAVQYVYEPAGGLTHIVDQAGRFISASYDALGRKTRVNDPDRGSWSYAWDGLGRLQFQTDARGRVTTQSYDVLGRPSHRSTVAGSGTPETATWHYDLSGQQGLLGWEEDSGGFKREYQYDALRRPTKVTTTIPERDTVQLDGGVRVFTMEYGYDRNHGRLKATRYPSAVNAIGETVALDYDVRGYLLGEVGLDGSYARTKAYRKVLGMSEGGQVTEQRLGNCVRETGEYDPSTGATLGLTAMRPTSPPSSLPTTDLMACPAPVSTQGLVRQDAYKYDRFMNLKRQTKNVAGSQREERFTYDALQRLTKATLCSGADCTPTTEVVDYAYDDLGNLTRKTDYGTSYLYGTVTWDAGSQRWVRGTGNAGPHAVRQVTKAAAAGGGVVNFTYDANGNLTDGDGRLIDFDLMDRPVRVRMGGAETEFSYGPTGGRYRQKLSGAPGSTFGPKTVYYVDKDYELTVWDTASTQPGALEERTFIGPSVTVLTKRTAAGVKTRTVRYRHVDRLGSPDADTAEDVGAALVEAHGFDAWGRPRDGSWLPSGDRLHPGGEPGTASTRGFTGHEHLDSAYLIHMNGRVYDYRLGRFLSVDPIISNPLSSQAINPYSYIGNNPLSGTDPTGYVPLGSRPFQPEIRGEDPTTAGNLGKTGEAPGNSGAVNATPKQQGTNPQESGGMAEVNKGGEGGGWWERFKKQAVEFLGVGDWMERRAAEMQGALARQDKLNQVDIPATSAVDAKRNAFIHERADATVDGALEAGKEGAILVVGGVAEKTAAEAVVAIRAARGASQVAGQGFQSFSAAKQALGPAGPGKQWHHIVEQGGNVERFGAEAVHNTSNLVRVDTAVHRQISGFYSSKQPFTGGQTVRQWLRSQSFDKQMQFGLDTVRRFGGGQ